MMAGRQQIAGAEELLVEALALWRGEPLGDLSATLTGRAEATRLSELKLLAEEESADLALAQGRHAQLIAQLHAAVAASPLRERRWSQLMLALYRSSRQADALRAYQRLREVLGDKPGIGPSAELVALEEAILLQNPEISWSPRQVRAASPGGQSSPQSDLPEGLTGLRTRWFVGRQTEAEDLTARWRQAVDGNRQTVVLVGEPGIGKSTLVAALARRVVGGGGRVLYGGHTDEELRVPYQLVAEAVRGAVKGDGGPRLPAGSLSGELTRLLPELRAQRPDLPAPTPADPATEQYLLFGAVTELFASLTKRDPVLLVLDDLHLADRSTLPMVRHLIGSLGSSRLMVVATLRDNDPEALLAIMADLEGIWQHPGTCRVQLSGLSVDDVAELLGLGGWLTPPDQPRAAMAGELHRYTNGNPFFLSQIMEMRPDRHGSSTGSRRSGSVVSGVPSAVQEVVRARLNRLPESVQMMLSAAAVVGSAIPLELLRRLTEAGASTDLVLNAVDVAIAGGLLIERAAGQFAFAHDLVHEHLYANLGPARRLKLHLSVAHALESLAGRARKWKPSPTTTPWLRHSAWVRSQPTTPSGPGGTVCNRRRSSRASPSWCGPNKRSIPIPRSRPRPRAGLLLALAGACDAAGDNAGNRQRCLDAAAHRELPALRISWPPRPFRRQPGFAGQPDQRVLELCDEALGQLRTRSPCPSRPSSSHPSPITAAPTRDVIPPTTR